MAITIRAVDLARARIYAHSASDGTLYTNTYYIRQPPRPLPRWTLEDMAALLADDMIAYYPPVCSPDVIFDLYTLEDRNPLGTAVASINLGQTPGYAPGKDLPRDACFIWKQEALIFRYKGFHNRIYTFPTTDYYYQQEWPYYTDEYFSNFGSGWKDTEMFDLRTYTYDTAVFSPTHGYLEAVGLHGLEGQLGCRAGRRPGHGKR